MPATVPDVSLPNAGPGADPLSVHDVAGRADVTAILLLLHRDYYCGYCRKQVQAVVERYAEFRDADAEVVSILPEARERASGWADEYEVGYPMLADPDATYGDALEQPTRFGVLGKYLDAIGRMPQATILDVHDDEPTVFYVHRGDQPGDRPDLDRLLEQIQQLKTGYES